MSSLPATVDSPPGLEYPMSLATYHAMIEDGTLGENDPVELIEGELLFKISKNRAHRRATQRIRRALDGVLGPAWTTQVQDPITLPSSEPEPDICCVTRESEEHADPHPGPGDIGVVIEVAHSTLGFDRTRKLRMYARAGIVEYWFVNLIDRQIEVHTQPDAAGPEPRYVSRVVHTLGERVALPDALGGATIDVAALLPAG